VIFPKQFEPMDAPFIRECMGHFPGRLAQSIAAEYNKKPTRRESNLYLLRLAEKAKGQKFRLAGDEDAIRDWASVRANTWGKFAARYDDVRAAYESLADQAEFEGFAVPEPGKAGVTVAGAVARMGDSIWWRRQARKRFGRGAEGVAISAGIVTKHKERYASDDAVVRRTGQKARNRQMLEECQAVNELGEVFTLAELSDLSVSNPIIRRSELMVRISGCETIAAERGDCAEFITWTCPSRYHAHSKKYDSSTPRQAAQHLQKMWSQCRAKLAREGLSVYGLRVAEPHKDGCPHWHMLLFMRAEDRAAILRVMRFYALKVDRGEPGANKNRFKSVAIDPSKGSAAGYVAKYVSKNIDGFGVEQDLFHGDPVANANRVDAWASTWGIRQFQFIGGPSVTVWRELRRLDSEESGVIEEARQAADSSDWAAYIRAQGGPFCGRSQNVGLATWEEIDGLTGELLKSPKNRFGEDRGADVFGVTDGCLTVVTRSHKWEILSGGEAVAPWSSVNNCTECQELTFTDIEKEAATNTEIPPDYIFYSLMLPE
jgi:hypothetical protein